jgi:lysozyme
MIIHPMDLKTECIPPECIDMIRQWESLKLTAYPDPTGIPSIGYGHTRGVTRADITNRRTITRQEAERLLMEDLEDAVSILRNSVSVDLTPCQFGALASFVYNVGGGRKASPGDPGKDGFVTLKNGAPSTMRRKLNSGDYEGAALEFNRWVYAGGKRLNGLVSRRTQEAAMFCREAPEMVSNYPKPLPIPSPSNEPTRPPVAPQSPSVLVDQPSSAPTRKWTYGAVCGGLAGLASFILVVFWNSRFPEDQIPAEYVAALPSAFTYIGVLATQYMTRNRATDIPPG